VFDHFARHRSVFLVDRTRRSFARVADLIVELGCDVVCFQEVDAGSFRNGRRNLLDEIADAAGFPYRHFARQRGLHCNDGIALMSRLPLERVNSVVLVHDIEQRGMITADVEVGGQSVTVGVTHLAAFPFNASLRRRQCEQIARELEARERVVLGADFNCDPDAAELLPLRNHLGLRPLVEAPSFPAYGPKFRFDNVFASRDVSAVDARVLTERHSDHLAVLARVSV
jgi:endonuclease/exonuclease/phosphatase family metal-dependent hydrolase